MKQARCKKHRLIYSINFKCKLIDIDKKCTSVAAEGQEFRKGGTEKMYKEFCEDDRNVLLSRLWW